MNPILRFSSQLTLEDLRKFLTRYAGFRDCIMEENVRPAYANEIYQYFLYEGVSYVLSYSDYYVLLKTIDGDCEEIQENKKFTTSDWLCFLKSKFGAEFVSYYASEFKAEDIVYEESQFLSKISFGELAMILKKMFKESGRGLLPFDIDDDDVEVIERESFFQSERRFAIWKKSSDLYFFIRLSDFQSINPRLPGKLFFKFMAGKFGDEYLEAHQRYVYGLCHGSAWPGTFKILNTPGSLGEEN